MSKKLAIIIAIVAVIVIAAVLVAIFATGCDYGSAAKLEAAINRGIDVTGKTAKVKIDSVHDDTFFGLCKNYWAGEHLNLLSVNDLGIKAGDTVKIHVNKVTSALGSHMIDFTVIK